MHKYVRVSGTRSVVSASLSGTSCSSRDAGAGNPSQAVASLHGPHIVLELVRVLHPDQLQLVRVRVAHCAIVHAGHRQKAALIGHGTAESVGWFELALSVNVDVHQNVGHAAQAAVTCRLNNFTRYDLLVAAHAAGGRTSAGAEEAHSNDEGASPGSGVSSRREGKTNKAGRCKLLWHLMASTRSAWTLGTGVRQGTEAAPSWAGAGVYGSNVHTRIALD